MRSGFRWTSADPASAGSTRTVGTSAAPMRSQSPGGSPPYEALVQVHVAAEAGAASFADITNARELYSASLAAA